MKKCFKCKLEKEESDFSKDTTRKDGLNSKCKSCQSEYYKKYLKKNKEVIRLRQSKWYRNRHETS